MCRMPKPWPPLCRRWKTSLKCADSHAYLLVDGYYPEKEIRTAEASAAVSHVAACPRCASG